MRVIFRTLLVLLVAAALAPFASATGNKDADRVQVEARLLVGSSTGDPLRPDRVGVRFDLAPGWHVYWKNPGATGLPTEVELHVDGATVGPLAWPAPETFDAGGDPDGPPSYGYERQVLLFAPVALESTWRGDAGAPRVVRAEIDLLVCEYECVPFRFDLAQPFTIDPSAAKATDALFEKYAARVPRRPETLGLELEARYSQNVVRPGDRFEAAIAVRSCRAAADCEHFAVDASRPRGAYDAFHPEVTEPIELAISGVRALPGEDRTELLLMQGESDGEDPIALDRLRGVLFVRSDAGERIGVEVDLPLPSAEAGTPVSLHGESWLDGSIAALAEAPATLGLWKALLLALVGGLVLNLMPCVLPVLAIKVFGIAEVARTANGRREMIAHGAAYTGGVLASMLALATVVVLLRVAGQSVGWGFQFQEPIYVAAISAILVAFAMNLFGAFEINIGVGALADVGREAAGARRSFFEGLLAVALATPCSAPFLGTAVGFAFASDPATIVAIFGMIGLGLAAPFAAITLVPRWARWVPRSGSWLLTVRSVLGFALIGTVVWLLAIFGASSGAEGIIALTALLVVLAFALWTFGRMQQAGHPRMTLLLGLGVVGISLAGLNGIHARVASSEPATRTGAATQLWTPPAERWQPWSPTAVAESLARGIPVFVRFTADWCVTCKVNERVVLEHDDVAGEMARLGFTQLVGDWTHRDETIRAELARFGRAGVPVYLVYSPDTPREPVLLPELLTRARVTAALRAASGARDEDHPETPKQRRSARR